MIVMIGRRTHRVVKDRMRERERQRERCIYGEVWRESERSMKIRRGKVARAMVEFNEIVGLPSRDRDSSVGLSVDVSLAPTGQPQRLPRPIPLTNDASTS